MTARASQIAKIANRFRCYNGLGCAQRRVRALDGTRDLRMTARSNKSLSIAEPFVFVRLWMSKMWKAFFGMGNKDTVLLFVIYFYC